MIEPAAEVLRSLSPTEETLYTLIIEIHFPQHSKKENE